MSVASQARSIDDLTAQAAKALKRGRLFEADRAAAGALSMAQDENAYDRMAKVLPTLSEARRLRMEQAFDVGTVAIVEEPFADETKFRKGCYLVRPPLVGADARRLRLLALGRDIPLAVVCREPTTQLRLCPVVAISPGVTVRTKVDPPSDPDRPDLDWFMDALDALGEAALESIDPEMEIVRRIDAMMARLEAVPEYKSLHQCLEESCLEAHEAASAGDGG